MQGWSKLLKLDYAFQGVLNDVKERIQTEGESSLKAVFAEIKLNHSVYIENLADRVNKTLGEDRHTSYILDMTKCKCVRSQKLVPSTNNNR